MSMMIYFYDYVGVLGIYDGMTLEGLSLNF